MKSRMRYQLELFRHEFWTNKWIMDLYASTKNCHQELINKRMLETWQIEVAATSGINEHGEWLDEFMHVVGCTTPLMKWEKNASNDKMWKARRVQRRGVVSGVN